MKYVGILFFIGLIVYSACLLSLDFQQGQPAVRGYFSDIVTDTDYPVYPKALFGINTSISVSLLGGCALLYLVCIGVRLPKKADWKSTVFLWSQVAFFLYMAADERLRIHEWLGACFGVEDAFILLGMGGLEVFLLVYFGDVLRQSWRTKIHLLITSLFFGLMVFVDAFIHSDMFGRLAVEDLSKLWAVVFLFVYAWCCTMERLSGSERALSGS
jgi:hypothetical protein